MPKSKFFRVATEGATTDGREIQRSWIEQMAKNFDRNKYGARIWIEHLRGLLPDSAFAAQGDVLALEARAVEDGKLALFAQIEPLESLVAMNKKGQKLYTSIEIDPNFANSGQAYLTGLAVTDSPASLGTEILTFASQAATNPFAQRKTSPGTLFTAAQEFTLELEGEQPDKPSSEGVLATAIQGLTQLMGRFASTNPPPAPSQAPAPAPAPAADQAVSREEFGQVVQSVQTIAQAVQQLGTTQASLVQTLSQQPANPERPAAAGGNGQQLADF